MSLDKDCFICRKHREQPASAVYADARVVIGHALAGDDGAPPLLGNYLIEPKRHLGGVADLNDEEAKVVGLYTARSGRVLQELSGAEHIYVFVLGHQIDHLHVHIVPRYPGTPRQYWGMRGYEWPDAPRGTDEAVLKLNVRMRSRLAEEGI